MTRHKKNIPIRIQSAPPHGFTGSVSPWKASLSVSAELRRGLAPWPLREPGWTRLQMAPMNHRKAPMNHRKRMKKNEKDRTKTQKYPEMDNNVEGKWIPMDEHLRKVEGTSPINMGICTDMPIWEASRETFPQPPLSTAMMPGGEWADLGVQLRSTTTAATLLYTNYITLNYTTLN